MFRFNSFIKVNHFNFNTILRNFQSTLQKNLIFKEPIDQNIELIQQNNLIESNLKFKTKYSNEEIQILYDAVMKHGKSWKWISENYFSSTRTPATLGASTFWMRWSLTASSFTC